MKFLANENIPLQSIAYLIDQNIDILSIAKNFPGISDQEVIDISIKNERTIITLDSDYGELIFKLGYKPKAGVIYFRLGNFSPISIGKILFDLIIRGIDFSNSLTVVDKNSIRIRKY
ncbi:MAG: DUF5615 family PIN-like protein [Mongoliitalea sp.]